MITLLHLPDDWRKRVRELVSSNSETENIVKRRDALHGLIDEANIPAYEKRHNN